MWVKQFRLNEYDQAGYYSVKVWENKPTLIELAEQPLESLTENELINLVSLYKGEEVENERIVEVNKDGIIPYKH